MDKPTLSFWQIWNMSFGFLGIQFGFALQNANTSRIFQTLNAEIDDIAILWIAAPVTGLLVQPIIGYWSDRTWNKLGRRRPFFLAGALLASTSLLIMPNSFALWMAAGMLWIMDASINVTMEPFRAFVGDNLPAAQRTKGFAMQSFFIGTGAVIASMLPWMLTNWFGLENTAPEGVISDTVKWSYYLGAGVFLLAVLWTVFKSFEYPPDKLNSFSDNQSKNNLTPDDIQKINLKKQKTTGVVFLLIGLIGSILFYAFQLKKDLYVLAGLLSLIGILLLTAAALQKKGKNTDGFISIMNDLQHMPQTMKQLAWVQFFSWFALFSMWIYTTAAVTDHIFGTTDTSSQAYNDGADWVGICFAVYNGIAAIVAFLIPVLAKLTSRKNAHMICLFAGALGLFSIFYIQDPNALLFSMVGIGIAWASILSVPYAILTGSLPAAKMGYYMGVFNFFIVIPQIVAASILGFLLKQFFDNNAIYAMIIGGLSFLIAGLLTLNVRDEDELSASQTAQ